MTPQELFDNYYKTCYHYAYVRDINVDSNFVSLKMANNTITITNWNHTATQPTENDLLAYTLSDVDQTWELRNKNQEQTNHSSTFQFDLTGPWFGTQQIDFKYSLSDCNLILMIPEIKVIGDNSSSIIQSTNQISFINRPRNDLIFIVSIIENGIRKMGILEILADGNIKIYSSVTLSNFLANIGDNGLHATSVSYLI